jgi:hypothetical protein
MAELTDYSPGFFESTEVTTSKWAYSPLYDKQIKPCKNFWGRTHPIFEIKRRLWRNKLRDYTSDGIEYYYSQGLLPTAQLYQYLAREPKFKLREQKYKSCILVLECDNQFFQGVKIEIIWKQGISIKKEIDLVIDGLKEKGEDQHIDVGLPMVQFDFRILSSVRIAYKLWIQILEKVLLIPLDSKEREIAFVSIPDWITNTEKWESMLVVKSSHFGTKRYIKKWIAKSVERDYGFLKMKGTL